MQAPPGSPKRRSKSSRREGIRAAPKKQGHGGWGKITDQGGEEYELFLGDPNFDDEDEWVDGLPADFQPRRKRNNSSVTFEVSTPRVSPHDMEELTKQQIRQYLHNEDMEDFVHSIEKMKIDANSMGEIILYAVNLAMDMNNRERELVSSLISGLYPKHCSDEAIRKGINQLVMSIDEIIIDCPFADELLAKFLARAVADDCLAPCFLQQQDGLSALATSVVTKAGKLLNGPHGMARLDTIWGQMGGSQDLALLTEKMNMFITEFNNSGDQDEVLRCLVELDVPHYHHECVYQLVYNALQNPDAGDAIFALLKKFVAANFLCEEAVESGFRRIYADVADIALDVPYAQENLDYWVTDAHNAGVLSDALYSSKPRVGSRKRYASSSLPPPARSAQDFAPTALVC